MLVVASHRGQLTRLLPLVVALGLALGACNGSTAGGAPSPGTDGTPPPASPAFPVTVTDDDGIAVTLSSAPQRIVTFAPSDTEILFAIGEGPKVVAVSGSFDDYPAEARTLPHVGGQSGVEPNIESVVALHPDLLLTFGGRQDWKTTLRNLGIPVFSVDSTSLPDLFSDILTVGRVTGATSGASALVDRMRQRDLQIEQTVAAELRVTCFFEVYYPPLSTVGPGSFIFDLLRRAGCDPVTKDAGSPNPEWSGDQLVKHDPSAYLVGSAPGVSPEAIAKRPGFAALSAVKDGRVFVVDSDLVTRNGPRMIDGLQDLAASLYPAAFDG